MGRGIRAHRHDNQTTTSAPQEQEQENPKDLHGWVQWGDWVSDGSRLTTMLLVPGLLIAYIVLSDIVGFILLSIIIMTVLLYRLGTPLLSTLLIAVAGTVLLQLLFAKVLLVPLPPGLLLPWIG